MAKGLGLGKGFYWLWDISARLPEEVDLLAFFPLKVLDAYIVRQHIGPPDAPMCGPHQSDGDPTLEIYTLTRVGLLPICCKATGYPFQGCRLLHTKKPVNGSNKGREVSTLLEACLQVHLLLCPLHLLKTLLWCLCQMGLGICVYDAHVVNTVITILPEVTDQEVTPLFHGL